MKATKKLIFATVSLVAAASLTVGSTFAWFSYRSDVELGSVQFLVDSGDENLQVAVTTVGGNPTPSSFSYSLSENTIKSQINGENAIVYDQLTVKNADTNPVGSTNPIDLMDMNGSDTDVSKKYAAFDLVFRYTPLADSTVMPDLILDFESKITSQTKDDDYNPTNPVAAWKDLTPAEYGIPAKINKDAQIKARARDAARVAFLMKDDSSASGYKNKVWAPSEAHGLTASNTSDTPSGFYLKNLASDYNIHHNITTDAVLTPEYAGRVYAGIKTPTKPEDFTYSTITKFPAVGEFGYSELRLTVKVWLEGKDGDCLKTVLGDEFAFTLKFRTSTIKSAS